MVSQTVAVWEVDLWFSSCSLPGADAVNTALLWWRKSALCSKLMPGRWCIVEKQNCNTIISSCSLHTMNWTLMPQRLTPLSHPHFDHSGSGLLFFSFLWIPTFHYIKFDSTNPCYGSMAVCTKKRMSLFGFVCLQLWRTFAWWINQDCDEQLFDRDLENSLTLQGLISRAEFSLVSSSFI